MDKSIEAAAEAYYYAVVSEFGAHASWDEFTEDEKAYHTEKMQAAIAAYRDAEIERMTVEVTHWKANHDNRVQAARFFIERPDMPVERVAAYDAHMAALQEIADLRAKLEASHKELREIAESINDPRVNLTMTAAEWCIEAQAKLEAAERDASSHQKMLEYVARIAYRKGYAGVVNFGTGEHDIDSTISGARKWLAEDAARLGGERG